MNLKKIQSLLNKKFVLFFLVVIMFWMKTYMTYRTQFHLGIDNKMQAFLLFINPISSALLFFGIALFFKGRGRYWAMFIINLILSFVLYANVVYYRFFNDFITLPTLEQTQNFGEVTGSAKALMKPFDIFFFTDTIIILALILFKVIKPQERVKGRAVLAVFTSAIMVFIVNLSLAEADRPQLLSRTFDRNYLVKYLGQYNYQIYDIIQTSMTTAQRAFADSNDLTDVENWTKSNYTKPNPEYFGKAKGMNVIYISMESLQNWMINYKLDGKEVTPFLNKLTHDKNTFYFDNFFHQTGQGKTSDAEFMMENSLFPLPQGSVFSTKAQNTYQAAPSILSQHGYTTAALHGNSGSFWNRDDMYKSLGYDKFFDAQYYDMSDKNVINYGLKDKPFVEQSMPYLEGLKQPFYAKMIWLSNHFPFILPKEDIDFPEANTDDGVVNRYFQTAHYMDEALEQFFNDLKKSGLYKNTIVVMYGDHYGISENHNKAMSQVMGEKITPYVNAQLQRVPLFIHVPGVKGKIDHTYGGEVDVRPTILHLLGIDTKDFISFGSDLLSKEHREIVPFRNGDFVTPKYTQVNGTCYENPSGKVAKDTKACKPFDSVVKKELALSDKVVYGDLLRFYQPKGYKPVNRQKYDYASDQTQGLTNWKKIKIPGEAQKKHEEALKAHSSDSSSSEK
ncbi:lipoteichoic acid synthase [Scopulibacillus daqui]|uniref:Lipoteichoic acid synthase n=1 Tax=Scopulibacillus daqui TaxID=1469162 RepID=A0ABS2Q1B1_9BACL|nr:LTA synthase family protein [Scopulibacillus daqui]MBM7645745.1 lipoteichoic acid synthase [Scopulibacillus daqui]